MTWHIKWDDRARKELRSLDHTVQKKILRYVRERAVNNPRDFGRGLVGDKLGLWRYRVDNYRVICRIEDDILTVLVLYVGHRKEVYD